MRDQIRGKKWSFPSSVKWSTHALGPFDQCGPTILRSNLPSDLPLAKNIFPFFFFWIIPAKYIVTDLVIAQKIGHAVGSIIWIYWVSSATIIFSPFNEFKSKEGWYVQEKLGTCGPSFPAFSIWSQFLTLSKLVSAAPRSFKIIFVFLQIGMSKSKKKVLWSHFPYAIIWGIGLQRNTRIFNDQALPDYRSPIS